MQKNTQTNKNKTQAVRCSAEIHMIFVLHVVDILKSKKALPYIGYDSNMALILHWKHLFHILPWGIQQ